MSFAVAAILVLVLLVALALGTVAMIVGTLRKSRWGVNLEINRCPRCGAEQPRVRKPASFRQAMWGGSTCVPCGLEHDKWGRAIGPE